MFLNRILRVSMLAILISLMVTVSITNAEVKNPQLAETAATVNGATIYREELDGEVVKIQQTILGYGKPLTCKQVASIRTEVLESMIRREVLYQESRKAGIKPDEGAVDNELKALRKQFQSETEYKNELGKRNLSEELLRSRLERNSSLQQYIERFAAKVEVTDDDIIAYYQGHLDLFRQPLQVRVSHILIQTDPKSAASRKQEARKKAEQILKDIKKGKDFANIAREQSDGPTRTAGGDIGYIRIGQLEKQLEEAVFTLRVGDISGIVETDYGFHIFKVVDKKAETVLAYDEVKEKIRQLLRNEKARQEADLQAVKLREKAVVEILPIEESSSAKQL